MACPRLSIDWGEGFTKPTLTPYEALVALGAAPGWWNHGNPSAASPLDTSPVQASREQTGTPPENRSPPCSSCECSSGEPQQPGHSCGTGAGQQVTGHYPMDYYSQDGGTWSSTYHRRAPRRRPASGPGQPKPQAA